MKLDQLVDQHYLQAILDALPSPVLIVDTDLTIHDANHASKKLLGDDISAKLMKLCGDTLGCIHAFIYNENSPLSDSAMASVPIVEKSITLNFRKMNRDSERIPRRLRRGQRAN